MQLMHATSVVRYAWNLSQTRPQPFMSVATSTMWSVSAIGSSAHYQRRDSQIARIAPNKSRVSPNFDPLNSHLTCWHGFRLNILNLPRRQGDVFTVLALLAGPSWDPSTPPHGNARNANGKCAQRVERLFGGRWRSTSAV